MKIKYFLEAPWPSGVRAPRGIDGINWERSGEIPFVPTAGLMVDPGSGDFYEVEQVFWFAERPDELEVHFKFDDMTRPAAYYIAGGWHSPDLPKRSKRKGATP